MLGVLWAVAVVVVVGMSGTVRAQDAEVAGPAEDPASDEAEETEAPEEPEAVDPRLVEARQVISRGSQLFDAENYEAALAQFQRAYELLDGHPKRYITLGDIAEAYQRLFRYDLAVIYYQRFLDEAPADDPERGAVEATAEALAGFLGTVTVTLNVPTAEVWMDGHRIGDAPGDLQMPAGNHTLELRAPAHLPAQVEVRVIARGSETVEVELEAIPEPGGLSPAFFWTANGLAAASLLTGGIVGVVALVQHGDLRSKLGDPVMQFEVTQDDIDRVERLGLTADILLLTGVGLTAAAVVLYFLTDWGTDEAGSAIFLVPAVSPDGAGLTLRGAL